jgi:hypothetical protein
MNVEQFVGWKFTGNANNSEQTCPNVILYTTKPNMTWPVIELRLPRWEAGDLPRELWPDHLIGEKERSY